MHPIHAANQHRWNAAASWAARADRRGLWLRCPTEPELVLAAPVRRYLEDITDRRICVLGSGDNQAVFAFAGMGAPLTELPECLLLAARKPR